MNHLFSSSSFSSACSLIEPLESRIAPAGLPLIDENGMQSVVSNNGIPLHAGQGLSTEGGFSGTYLLYVLKGNCIVWTSDFNNNKKVDFNEITGISAGDGLQLLCFTDIHGDIVTNLMPNGIDLTDSDHNAANGEDGRILLPSRIEMIQMRSLETTDIAARTPTGQLNTLDSHINAYSSHSIYGGIYAGGGLGFADETNTTGGLWFGPNSTGETSTVTTIKVGSAASGAHFSETIGYGGPIAPSDSFNGHNNFANKSGDIQGIIASFSPAPGITGANINGIHSTDGLTPFNLGTVQAGNGGFGAAGGDIANVEMTADSSGGYKMIAGNGGQGLTGGNGGNIVNFSDLGSITSSVIIKSGSGGVGLTGAGGNGGTISFGTMNIAGMLTVATGSGGNGYTNGGNGASFTSGVFTVPDTVTPPTGIGLVSTTRDLDPILVDPLYVDPTAVHAPSMISADLGTNPHPVPGMPSGFWPSIPSVGTAQAVDFNHDGFGDAVFTTANPDQVVVLFGDGTGGYDYSKTVFLNCPTDPGVVVVGDFNNDGHPDIAVASTTYGYSGISVYLSQYATVGGAQKFVGFTDAIQSTLPVFVSPSSSSGAMPPTEIFGQPSPMQTKVLHMAVGDFNGDHINDLAVQVQYNTGGTVVDKVIFMSGDIDERGFGNGYFFSDWGHGLYASVSPVATSGQPVASFFGDQASVHPIKASPYFYDKNAIYDYNGVHSTDPGWHDLLYAVDATGAQNTMSLYSNMNPTALGAQLVASVDLGTVDTNRAPDKIALAPARPLDFALADTNGDGATDILDLVDPSIFKNMVATLPGDSTTVNYPVVASLTGVNQAGFVLAGDAVKFVGVVPTDGHGLGDPTLTAANDTGNFQQFAFVSNDPILHVEVYDFPTNMSAFNDLGTVFADVLGGGIAAAHNGNYGFDVGHYLLQPATPGVPSKIGYGVLEADYYGFQKDQQSLFTSLDVETKYGSYNYSFIAGDGGNGALGSGGMGGSIGAGHLKVANSKIVADLSIEFDFPVFGSIGVDPSTLGMFPQFVSGSGGNGFVNGGGGGGISGVYLLGNYTTALISGHGGNGFKGVGGNGGNLSMNHIDPGMLFQTGYGGSGAIGGNGGSILGNQLFTTASTTATTKTQFFDTLVPFQLTLQTGDGGHGTKGGGNGGDILNFAPSWSEVITAYSLESGYQAHTGFGGGSVSGRGGNGGSILNSGPAGQDNLLKGDIDWRTGQGGDGLSGGNGGAIDTFINRSSDATVKPSAVSIVAGDGGAGISGSGGTGGNISNIQISGYGTGASYLYGAKYNRLVAGAGGSSAGAGGGTGGSLTNFLLTAEAGAVVAASGAGGSGLTSGGSGGTIDCGLNGGLDSTGFLGSDTAVGRVVAIAGQGGDTLASLPFSHSNPDSALPPSELETIKAFGGVNGKAGNGGSILNFYQRAGLNTVVDLIAGNGGSTLNYGTDHSLSGGAGRGGSITGAVVTTSAGISLPNINGNLGNSDPDVAIKAYNNISGDYHADITMAQFVETYFRDAATIYSLLIDDALGNVGVVAGASGHVGMIGADGRPEGASYGVNGSVSNLVLNNGHKILSMVAGGVDNISKIASITGVSIGGSHSGALGADKEVVAPGSPTVPHPPALGELDYYNLDGLVVNTLPQTGFGLIDGIIFAQNTGGLTGLRVQS